MVSDVSFEELHEFAQRLEIPKRGFHGDHYDVPLHIREIAVSRGAIEVTSRELLWALNAAGLRVTAKERRDYKNVAEADHGSGASVSDRGQ
jgi:hypothetical protein